MKNIDGRMTISQAAARVGVAPKTLQRWEKAGKVKRAHRDWRGWRIYREKDIEELVSFHEAVRIV